MKIGYSLSFCVRDIIRGMVAIEDVACVVTTTMLRTEQDWQHMLTDYTSTYWRMDPAAAAAVCYQLRKTDRIVQPRLLNPNNCHSIAGGHWQEMPANMR